MTSILWDVRTILNSSSQVTLPPGSLTDADKPPPRLGPLHVWHYLISLSEDDDIISDLPDKAGKKLKHFKPTDFGRSWNAVPTELGSGTSYSVEKYTLAAKHGSGDEPGSDEPDKPAAVAVKRLNIFRDGAASSQRNSAALQVSVATVLKELRILTHRPLRRHPNLVSLLGYRSEFGLDEGPTAGPPRQSTDVSLVMEFAPHGTLKDFLASDKGRQLDFLTKAHLMHDIAGGLDALHRCGIAHGDVKLENTLVFHGDYRSFRAKLSDLGHALVDLKRAGAKNQRYLGTPLLNAPEVRPRLDLEAPISNLVDADGAYKCDVYSYGLLVWEIILDGARFCKTLGDVISDEDGGDQMVYKLNDLPKEELLLRALTSLESRHDKDNAALVQMLRALLQATLRDDPKDRKTSEEIIKIFRGQTAFHDDDVLSDMFYKDRPTPYLLPRATIIRGNTSEHSAPPPQMPPIVQADLVRLLHSICNEATLDAQRRSALYDLGMCTIAGFGTEVADLDKGLGLLIEAAELGSPNALGLVFRLHDALGRELPPSLREMAHPIAEMERDLARLDSQDYLAERIRRLEKLHQQDALGSRYDILHKGEIVISDVSLDDADFHKTLQAKADEDKYDPEQLQCLSRTQIADKTPIQGLLIYVAARLGLLPLIKLLFGLPAPSSGKAHWKIISREHDEDLLAAACHGGHLDMLEFLVSVGAEPAYRRLGTATHWLVMFPDEQAARAMELLLTTRAGKASLQVALPAPGVDMQHYRLRGTPLEFAIAANSAPVVELLIGQLSGFAAKFKDPLTSIGWTDVTFGLAVSLNLSGLLPQLILLELDYRRSRPSFAEKARFNRSLGHPEMGPFGLFELSRPPGPILPLLIHGGSHRAHLESSIDLIVASGICAIDDEDAKGSTALTHAVRFSPCDFGAAAVEALISRGARLGKGETPARVVLGCIAMRHGRSGETITRILLEAGLFPLSTQLLIAAVQTGKVGLVQTILSFDDEQTEKQLDVRHPVIEDGEPLSLLHLALSVPNNASTIRLLLDRGADIDATWEDKTPLEAAISLPACDAETIDLLIARGARLVSSDGTGSSILHRASYSLSRVDGAHVMSHLLSHPRVRALVDVACSEKDSGGPAVSPLYMACFAGNAAAAHALLRAGAATTPPDGMPAAVDMAVAVGRRPQMSPVWVERGDLGDEEAVDGWRRGVEGVVLALLDRTDPGHGRTRLHVAAGLGNRRRVVELIERGGMRALTGDREKLLPTAYVEDFYTLEEAGADPAYVENLRLMVDYLQLRMVEEVSQGPDNPDTIQDFLVDNTAGPSGSTQEQEAISELEARMENIKLTREEMDSSLGDGRESPAEIAARLEKVLETQKQEYGEGDLRVLRTMTSICEIYGILGRIDEAEELHGQVLRGREAQLPPDHEDLYEAYMDHLIILCLRDKFQEAHEYGLRRANDALNTFGVKHPVTIIATAKVALTDRFLGNVQEAISKQELALQLFDQFLLESPSRSLSDAHRLSHISIRNSLVHDYCTTGAYGPASEQAKLLATQLEHAKTNHFFQTFDLLIDGATSLDAHGRYDDSEPILVGIVGSCAKRHGRQRSHCTRTALQRLAAHYGARGMWEEEGRTLQALVDALRLTMGAGHASTLAAVLGLAECRGRQERWLEAAILREQALDGQEQLAADGDGDDGSEVRKVLDIKILLCGTFRSLGEMDKSERYGREALQGCRDRLAEDDDATLKSAEELASTLCYDGKVAEAIDLQRWMLDTLTASYGEMHTKIFRAAEMLCASLLRAGRVDEATVEAERCLRIGTELPGSTNDIVSECLYILASCKEKAGKIEEALQLYQSSIDKANAAPGGDEPTTARRKETLVSMTSLAKLYLETEHYPEGEQLLHKILADAPKAHGTDDNDAVQFAHTYLGYTCEATGRADEAVTHYESSAATARRLHGDSAAETVDCLHDLVRGYLGAGDRVRDAHLLALQVLRYRRERLGEYHADTVDTKIDLCTTYRDLGMWPEAERMQRDVLRYLQARPPDQLPEGGADEVDDEIFCMLYAIAQSCNKQGRYKQAEEFARAALENRIRRRGGAAHPQTILATVDLAYVLVDAGKLPEAEQLSSEAYDASSSLESGPESTDEAVTAAAAAAESLRALVLSRQDGRLAEAEAMQRRVLARYDADDDNDDLASRLTELRFLADLLAKMGRLDEAAEAARDALVAAEVAAGGGGDEDEDIIDGLAGLASVYGKMGRWEEARVVGERARVAVDGWRVPGIYGHVKRHLEVLRALKPVYEALSEEEKLLDVELAIKAQERGNTERRQNHLKSLGLEDERFQLHHPAKTG